jgi:ferredoxin
MHHIHLQPSGLAFDTRDGETLLQAALRAGLSIPVSCRNGTCRTCRCTVISGRVVHTIEWPGLSREELQEGWVLPCVAQARSDVVLVLPQARRVAGT